MEKPEKNRQFILDFFQRLNCSEEKSQLLSGYILDPLLLEHFRFVETVIPQYKIMVDEITAESQRVIVRARFVGFPDEAFNILKKIEIPFAMGYHIKNGKIINHWLITDKLAILEQLGLEKPISHIH